MSEWKEYKFSDLLVDESISYGIVQPGSHTEINSVPVVRVNNIKNGCIQIDDIMKVSSSIEEGYKRTRLQGGELLITVVGSIGECAIVPENLKGWNVARAVSVARIKKEFDTRYIKYAFKADDIIFQMYGQTNDTVQPTLNLSSLKEIRFILPELSEQQSIASILSSLDDKIDLLHRQNKTLEALAETLFRQWFVENQTTFGKLGNLVEATFGGEWGKEVQESDYNFPVYCIRGTDIADLQVGLANRTPLRYVKEKKYKSIEMRNGDLVMEISGGSDGQSTGRTILINEDVKSLFSYPLVFSNFCRLIRPINPESGLYLLCYINMLYDQGDFFNLENGSSGIRNFDYKALLFELDYEIHDSSQILNFNKAVKPYFEKINKNKFQIRTLTQLRDTLLPKLMSGEVRVI